MTGRFLRIVCFGALVAFGPVGTSPSAAGADESAVVVRWLGVAGFSIRAGDTTILHDPYLSRPGWIELLLRRYRPNSKVLEGYLSSRGPAPEVREASLILIGHSHFDHLGDAPWFAEKTGATIAGTETTVNIAKGYGVPDAQLKQIGDGDVLEQGPFEIRAVESRHAKVLFGDVPFPGEVKAPPDPPIHAIRFRMGGALAFLVAHRPSGKKILLLSSAALHPPALEKLEGVEVDLLLPSIAGRDRRYTETLVQTLQPKLVIPQHFDDFTVPIERAGGGGFPGMSLDAFEEEVLAAAARAQIETKYRVIGLFETVRLE